MLKAFSVWIACVPSESGFWKTSMPLSSASFGLPVPLDTPRLPELEGIMGVPAAADFPGPRLSRAVGCTASLTLSASPGGSPVSLLYPGAT